MPDKSKLLSNQDESAQKKLSETDPAEDGRNKEWQDRSRVNLETVPENTQTNIERDFEPENLDEEGARKAKDEPAYWVVRLIIASSKVAPASGPIVKKKWKQVVETTRYKSKINCTGTLLLMWVIICQWIRTWEKNLWPMCINSCTTKTGDLINDVGTFMPVPVSDI